VAAFIIANRCHQVGSSGTVIGIEAQRNLAGCHPAFLAILHLNSSSILQLWPLILPSSTSCTTSRYFTLP
jgi:hypothetical protein